MAPGHDTGPWHALNMAGKDWNLNMIVEGSLSEFRSQPEANFASISLAGPWPFPFILFFDVLWIGATNCVREESANS